MDWCERVGQIGVGYIIDENEHREFNSDPANHTVKTRMGRWLKQADHMMTEPVKF